MPLVFWGLIRTIIRRIDRVYFVCFFFFFFFLGLSTNGERPIVFLMFLLFLLIFFYLYGGSFFIIRLREIIFISSDRQLKVMEKNDPDLKKPLNLQSYCPLLKKACYRYSSETIRDRDMGLLPLCSRH